MSLFLENLPENFELPETAVGQKLLKEYGAMFVAKNNVVLPEKVIFKNQEEVFDWQSSVATSKENIGGFEVELQTPAMNALKNAVAEAAANNLQLTPRGADAAKRDYAETIQLWASRVNPALIHWVQLKKLEAATAEKIKTLSPFEQVSEVLALETKGIYFAKDLSKSIIYSVAPPGASQHIAMLAFDVSEFSEPQTREILARHGWFQTVVSDLPHFTYLGVSEDKLGDLGLKKIADGKSVFWIPDI